ncbi:MAG: GNAT family N-acetyltransferase [Sulfurovum sp.]|nr:GNAT family N-acetyltransferase [Sulfurovum sp.]
MTIEALDERDKASISLWNYQEEHSGFNYAVRKGGWIDSYCHSGDSHCFVAKNEDAIIGLFFFITSRSNEFRILINPDFLNKGYGKALTKKALEIGFKQLKLKQISLIVRKNHLIAISLYEKMGFMTTGETVETIEGQEMEFLIMIKYNTLQQGK